MDQVTSINAISLSGAKIGNRIRIIMTVLLGLVVAVSAMSNPLAMNIFYCIGLILFIIITVVNILALKQNRNTLALAFVTVFIEVSIPTILKLGYAAVESPIFIVKESTLYSITWFMLLLTILHNRRSVTIFAGAVALVQYAALIAASVLAWGLPVNMGFESMTVILLDNEIVKLVVIAGFTMVAVVILRNINEFAGRAQNNEAIATRRSGELHDIIQGITVMNRDLLKISGEQDTIAGRFSEMSAGQAALSEELSAAYEEQYATIESITRTSSDQKREAGKSMELVQTLIKSQNEVRQNSSTVVSDTARILDASIRAADSLRRMVEKMEIIRAGGSTINGFIGVINDITDKINLLSLNAAIEAARAGDHGRGFAVVADEIGKLAVATSDNAGEISTQLARIIGDIENGAAIVQTTREANDVVVGLVKDVGLNIDQVKTAMEEQSRAIVDVGVQSERVEKLSSFISNATGEQLTSMDETTQSVQRIAELAQLIAGSTETIIGHAQGIHRTAKEMEARVQGID